MDRQDAQILLNEEYNNLGLYRGMPSPYVSEISAVAGSIPNVVSSPTSPAAISSGQATGEIKQVAGVWYSGKTSFSDTIAGYRLGIDTDGIAKFYFGDASGYIKWNGSTLTIAGLTGFIATGGAAADVNTYGTTISGGKITTGTVTATQLSATAIDGMTITGALIRTASSGQRIELNTTGIENQLRIYDTSGKKRINLSASLLQFYDANENFAGQIFGTNTGILGIDSGVGDLIQITSADVQFDQTTLIRSTANNFTALGSSSYAFKEFYCYDGYFTELGTTILLPLVNNTYNIGHTSYQWANGYINKLHGNGTDVNVIDLSLSNNIATNQVFRFKNATADPTGVEGGVYFNTTTSKLKVYAGGVWVNLH